MKTKQTPNKKSVKKTPKKLHARIAKNMSSHAKHILVPHKGNEYRPHLIRAQGIIAVLIIALVAQVTYGFIMTGRVSVLGKVADITTTDLLNDTNAEREKAGLTQLTINAQLSDAAYKKAQNMFKEQYWAHDSPSGIQPWKWFSDVGYDYSYAGENLAKNYASSQATVDAWMASPTHRANILKLQYVDVGFAIMEGTLNGEETTLVVAEYGAPANAVLSSSGATEKTATFETSEVSTGFNPVSYMGAALGALSPVTIGILGLLTVVGLVGITAHHYRDKLPQAWKKSWRIHHGMYTFVGMIVLGILVIVATGSGTI